ncbi:MAG: hypothetical protein JSS71_13030 [Armatimonadetes bacterium]|nr:hypothetical protein [Armatimonadota bacterium]MBX3109932.1 hypothetical protein [Fimbriimonadaceae bacterium]
MEIKIHEIIVELDINQTQQNVWDAMLNRLPEWWPADFVGFPGKGKVKFEPVAGGRLYKETEEGGQLMWGNVVGIYPGEAIEISSIVTPAFGGPSLNFIRMALLGETGGVTKFRLSNTVMGHMSAEGEGSVTEGWQYLFGGLKTYCEAN